MRTIIILLSAVMATTGLMAQGGPPPHAGGRTHASSGTMGGELAALDQFLTMDNAQLDQLQLAITRVRAMTPDERAKLRAHIADYRQLPVEQREKIRAGWGWQNDADRNDWPLMMHSLSEADSATIQTELQSLTPEQRTTRKHALLEAWRAAAAKKVNP